MKKLIAAITFCSLMAVMASAQTFEVPGQSEAPTATQKTSQKSKKPGKAASSAQPGGLGTFGSSIGNARYNRAAEQAIAKGSYAEAANFAERGTREYPQDARMWFLLGYTARLAGRTQTALSAYDTGLRLEPSSIEGLSGKAQTLMKMGKAEDAKKLLLQVIAANPRRPVDLAMAGELFMQSGDLPRATELLNRSEALKPDVHSEVLLAVAYMRMKQPARAKAILDRARAKAPRNPDVYRAIASFYREGRDYNNAIKALQQIPKKTPEILGELGYTYALAGMKKEAAATYVKAAGSAPKNINLQLSAADSLNKVGDSEGARKYLAQAQSIDPNHYRLHAIRAEIARSEHRTNDAIKEYNLALANIPQQGVPEGVLYPIQLRISLNEQYRDAGDMQGAQQQQQLAEAAVSSLDIQGADRPEFLRVRASVRSIAGNYASAENDLKEALKAEPDNINTMIQYAALLWRMKRPDDSRKMYDAALAKEPNNRFALESMGYLAREVGDNNTAEKFFKRLQAAYPNDYVAYLALGELYTAEKRYKDAQLAYEEGFKFAPTNAQIVSGGAHAGIESHDLKMAAMWLSRAKGPMLDDPRIIKQEERYDFFNGKYLESAQLGTRALKDLPNDRDVIVYLAYDLYNLGRYDDALRLVREKQDVLPKEANLPLLAGHVEKQTQLLSQAVDDYTHAMELDPKMADARVNRGFVLNDMQDADRAADDFRAVLKDQPNHGVARLGLAFSELQMHKGKAALDDVNTAEKILGESGSTHLARATAYRQMRLLVKAEKEYRAALQFAPDDLALHVALGDTLYHARKYNESIAVLKEALPLSPDDPLIYSQIAHGYAQLKNQGQTLRYVQLAEQQGQDQSEILLNTGEALMLLGDRGAAMQRFERALEAPDASRVDARLLIATLFAREGHWDEARQQVSLAFAESRIGEASPVTADNLIQAANLFTAMHDFDLAQRYFERARDAGAADQVVAIGMANSYLAQGESTKAEGLLAGLGNPQDLQSDYDYTLAMGNVYRERRDTVHALGMFARANSLSGEDDIAERGMQQLAGEEGYQINQKISVQSDVSFAPIYEDSTIYLLDQRLQGGTPPPPRSSIETRWTNTVRFHQDGLPLITGEFGMRNARGQFSFPGLGIVLDRNTYDYMFNGAINPIVRFGKNSIQFNTGVAETIRRDKLDPFDMNQNLFRQFVYMSTSSFWNWVQINGLAVHEAGPFTGGLGLHSRDLGAKVEFRVGHPWGNNALITGYSARDLLLRPLVREFFQTSTYAGWEHKFGQTATIRGIGEFIRAWRVQDTSFSTGQILRPAVEGTWLARKNWQFDGAFAFSRGQGTTAHFYDNVQTGFFISYVKPFRRSIDDGNGKVPVEYPVRFSFGVQEQEFFNATGRGTSQLRPVVRLTLF